MATAVLPVMDSTTARPGAWLAVRREPFRLLFPLGALLGAAGVGHWFLYASGLQSRYSGQGHALVQVQGFLMAFAAGFLLTMLQRRAGGVAAPSRTIIGIALALVGVTAFALTEHWVLAEAAHLAVLVLLGERAVRLVKLAGATGAPPAPFVLVPLGLALGAVGAVLMMIDPLVAASWPTPIGRLLVQEGTWTCIALGVGHMILPVLTGHPHREARGGAIGHVLVGLAIGATLVIQHAWGVRLGAGLRALVIVAELGGCMHAWRPARVPGTHRKLAWLSFWLVPLALLLVAALPAYRVAFLHVAFIGGFSLMTFAVAAHVIAAHGGFDEILARASWPLRVVGGLVLLAMVTRVAADFLARAYWPHVLFASALWLVALAGWMLVLIPKALRPRRTGDEPEPPQLVRIQRPR